MFKNFENGQSMNQVFKMNKLINKKICGAKRLSEMKNKLEVDFLQEKHISFRLSDRNRRDIQTQPQNEKNTE